MPPQLGLQLLQRNPGGLEPRRRARGSACPSGSALFLQLWTKRRTNCAKDPKGLWTAQRDLAVPALAPLRGTGLDDHSLAAPNPLVLLLWARGSRLMRSLWLIRGHSSS